MESRKIIKFGTSSYVLTLPYDWMQENGLDKGDSVNVCKSKSSLIITTQKEEIEKRAVLTLETRPLKLFNRELISYYLKNFNYIEIIGKNVLDKIEEIKIFKEKLSSVEIVEMSEDKIVLKDLTSPKELNLLKIISEIIDMEKTIFNELIKEESIERTKKHRFIAQLDTNINKLTFLAYKAINYNLDTIKDPDQVKDSIHYWRIVGSFEHIGDIVKRVARYLQNENNEHNHHINLVAGDVKKYFEFVTSLLTKDINLDNNLRLYLDKKQSLLRDIEKLRDKIQDDLNLFLVISQLFKDILGQLDSIILSIIDISHK